MQESAVEILWVFQLGSMRFLWPESVTMNHGSTHIMLAAELWPTSAFSLVLFSENYLLQTMPHSETSEENLLYPLVQQ